MSIEQNEIVPPKIAVPIVKRNYLKNSSEIEKKIHDN